MPPWYYTLVHSEARLGETEREHIRGWITAELVRMRR